MDSVGTVRVALQLYAQCSLQNCAEIEINVIAKNKRTNIQMTYSEHRAISMRLFYRRNKSYVCVCVRRIICCYGAFNVIMCQNNKLLIEVFNQILLFYILLFKSHDDIMIFIQIVYEWCKWDAVSLFLSISLFSC